MSRLTFSLIKVDITNVTVKLNKKVSNNCKCQCWTLVTFKIVYEKFNIILLFYYNIEFLMENESIACETYFQITFGIHFILMIIITKSINNVNKL